MLVFKPLMEGRDVIGLSGSQTGKTLAFGIPLIEKIMKFHEKREFVIYIFLNLCLCLN
jgi:superfamily II DNA/RNA helicase